MKNDWSDTQITDFYSAEDRRPQPEDGAWEQRDGSMIAVEDMSDRHLNNAMRLLRMQAEEHFATAGEEDDWREAWVDVF
ncbi:MAG: hypothetical protein AAF719_01185 [Pseudomonadota bacterium]